MRELIAKKKVSAKVALIAAGSIYSIRYLPFTSSMNLLRHLGLEDVVDDINPKKPTLPRSEIYCGQRALFSKRPYVIIPYSQIAWVYLYEMRAYGFSVKKRSSFLQKMAANSL